MDSITLQDIHQLVRCEEKPLATIYVPTHPAGQDGMQDELRLRHYLDQVEEWMVADGVRGPVARDAAQRARNLPTNKTFWQNRQHGLAIFLSADSCRAFRLPERVDELVLVGEHFHVKPLLPHVADDKRYLVLAFSQKQARLLAGLPTGFREIEVPNMPAGIEAIQELEEVQRGTQVHSMSRTARGQRTGVIHGQGGEADSLKTQLATYCREVDDALQTVLHNETLPLVIVAVGSIQPQLREHLSYSHVLPDGVEGNPDHLTGYELHQRVWESVQPALDTPRQTALARLRDTLNTVRSTTQISEVLRAAAAGKVDTVLVNRANHCWGKFDPATYEVRVHEQPTRHDDDLLDLAIHHTLRTGGRAYLAAPEEMPHRAEVAALYRYV